jgi:hypothetical protein
MITNAEYVTALSGAIEDLYFNSDKIMNLSMEATFRIARQSEFNNTIRNEINIIVRM